MKVVVQRVTSASVTVDGELISSIGRGLCCLVGLSREDSASDVEYMSRKLLSLRLFEDESGRRWARGVKDSGLELLCVSQFTLYSVLKGNKPDFHQAMGGEEARQLYQSFVDRLRTEYNPAKVKDGLFAAYMQVAIQNDGPVTINLESPPPNSAAKPKSDKGRQRNDAEICGDNKDS